MRTRADKHRIFTGRLVRHRFACGRRRIRLSGPTSIYNLFARYRIFLVYTMTSLSVTHFGQVSRGSGTMIIVVAYKTLCRLCVIFKETNRHQGEGMRIISCDGTLTVRASVSQCVWGGELSARKTSAFVTMNKIPRTGKKAAWAHRLSGAGCRSTRRV